MNVADMIILGRSRWASEPSGDRLADVSSFQRFAGDLSQFGH